MRLHHFNRQAVDHALVVLRDIEQLEHDLAQVVECAHQVAASPVEARTLRNERKQMPIALPLAEQIGLLVPFATLADNR